MHHLKEGLTHKDVWERHHGKREKGKERRCPLVTKLVVHYMNEIRYTTTGRRTFYSQETTYFGHQIMGNQQQRNFVQNYSLRDSKPHTTGTNLKERKNDLQFSCTITQEGGQGGKLTYEERKDAAEYKELAASKDARADDWYCCSFVSCNVSGN